MAAAPSTALLTRKQTHKLLKVHIFKYIYIYSVNFCLTPYKEVCPEQKMQRNRQKTELETYSRPKRHCSRAVGWRETYPSLKEKCFSEPQDIGRVRMFKDTAQVTLVVLWPDPHKRLPAFRHLHFHRPHKMECLR